MKPIWPKPKDSVTRAASGGNLTPGEIVWSDETYRIFEFDRAVKPTMDSLAQRVHPEDRADFQKIIDGASAGVTQFRTYLSFAAA